MKLQDLMEKKETVEELKAELKAMTKEMVEARSGGNDELAQTLKDNVRDMKERIKDAEEMEK